jgi:hypothetical protein
VTIRPCGGHADLPSRAARDACGGRLIGGSVLVSRLESQARHSEIPQQMVQAPGVPAFGIGELRPAPAGLPDASVDPPVVAESGDPFGALRVTDLVARLERGRPIRLAAIVARLNATHVDWLFSERVVGDAILQLAANWAADYRTTGGIVVDEGPLGATVTIEDSSRVDPWIVRQAHRQADACREALIDFSRRERTTGHD